MDAVVDVADYEDFRREARDLLAAKIGPDAVTWNAAEGQRGLFDAVTPAASGGSIRVPRQLAALLEEAACNCDPARWGILYRLLWRITLGRETDLLGNPADPDVHRVQAWARAVAHEVHKMHAFVRFRDCGEEASFRYAAWFEPRHRIVRRAAPFFVDRFASMRWSIVTPCDAALWDGVALCFVPGPHARPDLPEDASEALWRTYYGRIFNPARLNTRLMTKEVPRCYWHNLPELQGVESLTRSAPQRVARMQESTAVAPRWSVRAQPVPVTDTDALDACTRCPLWQRATQAVHGAGPPSAGLMLVGEQPGDEEDLQGKPFVGPAGNVLDRALAAAGIARDGVYVTNAVKHFKWEPRGKRRLHKTPAQREAEACRPWLEAEIERVAPRIIVALGATAAFALSHAKLGIASNRGTLLEAYGARMIVTYHPSAVLRADDGAKYFEALREDLAWARRLLQDESISNRDPALT